MSKHVARFILKACPASDHPLYHEWQCATLVIIVGADSLHMAEQRVRHELKRHHWLPLQFLHKDRLIEQRVTAEGGAIYQAYVNAKNGKPFWLEELDHIPFTTKKDDSQGIVTPRLDERFIDAVIATAGGHRLTSDEADNAKSRNADYRLGNLVLELKDIQEEGLEVRTRQEKLANLFQGYDLGDGAIQLDPSVLQENDYLRYLDIVGRPIQKRVTDAAKQVKSSITHLNDLSLKGGVILLNTGYGSMPSKVFHELAVRYASKDTSWISEVITVSTYTLTNGFDTNLTFAIYPTETISEPVERFKTAFITHIDRLMAEWGKSGFLPPEMNQAPVKPIAYEVDGTFYNHNPGSPESSIT